MAVCAAPFQINRRFYNPRKTKGSWRITRICGLTCSFLQPRHPHRRSPRNLRHCGTVHRFFSRTGASVRPMPVGKRRSSPSANQPVGVSCSVLLVTRRGGFGQRRKLGGAGRENPHRKGSRRSSACSSAALGSWRAGGAGAKCGQPRADHQAYQRGESGNGAGQRSQSQTSQCVSHARTRKTEHKL